MRFYGWACLAALLIFNVFDVPRARAVGTLFATPFNAGGGYYTLDTDTGVTTLHTPTSGNANHLAYDPANQRLVFTAHANNDWRLYSRDVQLDSSGQVVAIDENSSLLLNDMRAEFGANWPGGATNTNYDTTGAAAYHDGQYFLIPDAASGIDSPPNLLAMELAVDGNVNATTAWELTESLGGFGDITFRDEKMYFLSETGTDVWQFGYVDLAATGPLPVTVLSANYSGQLAFDSLGRLWTDNQTATSLTQIDPASGASLGTLTLTGDLPSASFIWADFATGPVPTTIGDFNGDGTVDGSDFLLWQREPSVGNLSDWQSNYGLPRSAPSAAVPEPATATILIGLCIAVSTRHSFHPLCRVFHSARR